jgi:hypothetical protein
MPAIEWKTVATDDYAAEGITTFERAEFGRSIVDIFPCPAKKGKWKYVIDGKVWGWSDDREQAMRDAEINGWDSEANTLYGRHMRP